MAQPPRKLSATEVAALVGGLIEADQEDVETNADGVEVRPYTFGGNEVAAPNDYHALRMINERFCRIARSVFLPMLRVQPRLSSFPPEIKSFDDYRDGLENMVSLTISRIEQLRGNQMIMLPPSFVSLLTGAYYGGALQYEKSQAQEFTATEQRVIEIVTEGLNEALAHAWRDLKELSFSVQNREENLQFATFVDGSELVVNCSFMVQLPGTDPASFDILYPLQLLKPISAQLRSRIQSDVLEDDLSWRDRLIEAILSVPLDVTGHLTETDVSLGRMISVTPGDIETVPLRKPIELRVEGSAMFNAELGEVAGRRALSLTTRRKGGRQGG